MAYEIYLKKNEEKRIVAGHSWVYANEVARIEGKDKNGSLATVYSHDGRYIGKGYINHASKILVRIFIRDNSEDGKELYLRRIKEADDYRRKLGYDNCYRMVFAEADNLPALIIDRYGDVLVMQCLKKPHIDNNIIHTIQVIIIKIIHTIYQLMQAVKPVKKQRDITDKSIMAQQEVGHLYLPMLV